MSRLTIAACAGVVLFYVALGLVVLAPEAVYSGDIGVKYVQAQALADNHFRSLDIPYPGEFLDPERELFPFRRPFIMKARGTTQAIFPPASAVLPALAVGPFGFRGFIALSILAAAVVLVATTALTPRQLGVPVIVTLGLAGPLWFYAISGWEHAPAIAFGTAAFAVAMRSLPGGQTAAFMAGVLAGAGAALRDEVILLAPGLLLAIWVRQQAGRPALSLLKGPLVATVAGLAVPLLLAAVIDVWWFNRPAAAHLRHAVHILQTALNVSDTPNPELPVLKPMTPRERYFTVVTYWLLGRGSDRVVASFVVGLVAALFIRWRLGSSIGLALWLAAIGWTAVTDAWDVLIAPKWVAGLLRVAPYVVFALIPLSNSRASERPNVRTSELPGFRPIVLFTTVTYLVIAYLGVDTNGGKSLGPRLLLPLLPLLTASAVIAIASYLRSPGITDRIVGGMGVAYVAVGLAIHLGGAVPAYRQRNLDDSTAILTLARSPERIVVADDMYTAQLLFPLYDRKIIFLADSPELGQWLGKVLADGRYGQAVLVSRNPEPAVMLPPLRIDRTEQQGRMVVQYWRR
jgi:hypothetical protein